MLLEALQRDFYEHPIIIGRKLITIHIYTEYTTKHSKNRFLYRNDYCLRDCRCSIFVFINSSFVVKYSISNYHCIWRKYPQYGTNICGGYALTHPTQPVEFVLSPLFTIYIMEPFSLDR